MARRREEASRAHRPAPIMVFLGMLEGRVCVRDSGVVATGVWFPLVNCCRDRRAGLDGAGNWDLEKFPIPGHRAPGRPQLL